MQNAEVVSVQPPVQNAPVPVGRVRKGLQIVLGRPGGAVALILLSLWAGYLFFFRGIRFFLVPSRSMEPTLLVGDYLVTLREPEYDRGDVVVLRDPEDPTGYVVKRIVALGGDTVDIFPGAMYVNRRYVSEPYTLAPADYFMLGLKVPPGHIFLLGDNRNNSEDSHLWRPPTQPLDVIVGKVRYIYYPYNRAGRFQQYPSLPPQPRPPNPGAMSTALHP